MQIQSKVFTKARNVRLFLTTFTLSSGFFFTTDLYIHSGTSPSRMQNIRNLTNKNYLILNFRFAIRINCHCPISISYSVYSNGHKQCPGRKYSPSFVFILTTRTNPSTPGNTSVTRPRGHSALLASFSIIITTSSFSKLCFG